MIMKFTKTLKINKVMKRVLLLFTFAAFVFAQKTASAQEKNNHKDRWEKYKSEKVAFITTKLDLTPQEAEKFWPVYNALEKERSDAQREKRLLEKQVYEASETLSDKEAVDLTREFVGNKKKECQLDTDYNEKFLEILPPQKVLVLYKAESEFRMYMFRKFREKPNNK